MDISILFMEFRSKCEFFGIVFLDHLKTQNLNFVLKIRAKKKWASSQVCITWHFILYLGR